LDDVSFTDWRSNIKRNLIEGHWVLIYEKRQNKYEDFWIYSSLVPNEHIVKSLSTDNWDLSLGQGNPGFGSTAPDFEPKYLRFGNFENIEPLVYYREFNDIKNPYLELSQEFIHYYNLYYDTSSGKYIKVHDDGTEEDIVIFEKNLIKVRLFYLKKYLAIKKSHLAIYFDLRRFNEKSLAEQGLKLESQQIKGNNYIYFIDMANNGIYGLTKNRDAKSSSRFFGKVLIPGKKNFVPDLWDKNKEFQDFIVGVDKDGNNLLMTCDSFKLVPNKYIQPVFFKRLVLKKYYDNPEKYTVGDNNINCTSLWNLSIDNNHKKYVVVLLGDLGKSLSYTEQMHWKHHNISPEGGMSDVSFRRSFQCEFLPPVMNDLLFKDRFTSFSQKWINKFSWPLFKPLRKEDFHYFKRLRIPLSDESSEFEEQVLCLTKILIDSLNEKEIQKQIFTPNAEKINRGINKLVEFFEKYNIKDSEQHITYLRDLQELRSSSVAHRKGKNFEKIAKKYKFSECSTIEIFDNLLKKALNLLEFLADNFKLMV
jgi:hypothetical protein